jgi:hypothetical protein
LYAIRHLLFLIVLLGFWLAGFMSTGVTAMIAAAWFLLWAFRDEPWLKRGLGVEGDEGDGGDGRPWLNLSWLISGLAIVCGAFAYLEAVDAYYFTQDDNFCGMLPELLQGCRSFFAGIFPEWQPYQLLGAPSASLGLAGYTYPPTFLSYFIARYLLGNEYATLEVMALLHLAGAYLAAYWAARTWRVSGPLAMAVGLSYALSGYMLITGRSWANALSALAWLPLLFGFAGLMARGAVSWKWAAGLGLAVGAFFHTGFAQLWVYGLMFLALLMGLLVISGAVPFRRSLWCVPGVLLGIAIAAPMMYVQMKFGSSVSRPDPGWGLVPQHFLAMLLPYPLVQVPHPQAYGNIGAERMGLFYYSGALFCVVGGLTLIAMAGARWSRRLISRNVLILCALIALLLACGNKAYLWPALHMVPWFDKFRNAERFMPLFILLIGLGGAIVLQRSLEETKHGKVWMAAAALSVAILMAFCAGQAPPAHWTFADKPYPPLPDELKALFGSVDPVRPQRVGTVAPMLECPLRPVPEPVKEYTFSMEQDFASVYGVPAIHGYAPLVWSHDFYQKYVLKEPYLYTRSWKGAPQSIIYEYRRRDELCKIYGVRWLTLNPMYTGFFAEYYPQLRTPGEHPALYVWSVPDVCPLAFSESNPGDGQPIEFDCDGVRVNVAGCPRGGPFIINFLAWPDFRVYADGRQIPFAPDQWGRIRVDLPPGTTMLQARYRPAWGKGLLLGGLMALAAVALMAVQSRMSVAEQRERTIAAAA